MPNLDEELLKARLADHDSITRLNALVSSGFQSINDAIKELKLEFKDELAQVNSRCPSKLCTIHGDEIKNIQNVVSQ